MEKENCISKCFPPKTAILHPLYLRPISSNKPFCLVNNINYYEECDKSAIDFDADYFIPKINMSEKLILKNIYNINSWTDVETHQKKNLKDSILTIERILDFSWISFYKNTKNDIDIIIKCYINFFKNTNKKNISEKNIAKILYSISKNIQKYEPYNIHAIIKTSVK